MKSLDRSGAKIKEIEKLLAEVKDKLKKLPKEDLPRQESWTTENTPVSREKSKAELKNEIPISESLLSESALRNEYERLYGQFTSRKFEPVRDFIRGKSKNYLKSFCKANNLPIDAAKASKDKIAEEVMQWMARRNAITKKFT
jgi:hypothetical protein